MVLCSHEKHTHNLFHIVIGLHKGVEIRVSIMLRSSRRVQVLSAQLAVHKIFLSNHFLTPQNDVVHVRSRHSCQLGNASRPYKTTRNVLCGMNDGEKMSKPEIQRKIALNFP